MEGCRTIGTAKLLSHVAQHPRTRQKTPRSNFIKMAKPLRLLPGLATASAPHGMHLSFAVKFVAVGAHAAHAAWSWAWRVAAARPVLHEAWAAHSFGMAPRANAGQQSMAVGDLQVAQLHSAGTLLPKREALDPDGADRDHDP